MPGKRIKELAEEVVEGLMSGLEEKVKEGHIITVTLQDAEVVSDHEKRIQTVKEKIKERIEELRAISQLSHIRQKYPSPNDIETIRKEIDKEEVEVNKRSVLTARLKELKQEQEINKLEEEIERGSSKKKERALAILKEEKQIEYHQGQLNGLLQQKELRELKEELKKLEMDRIENQVAMLLRNTGADANIDYNRQKHPFIKIVDMFDDTAVIHFSLNEGKPSELKVQVVVKRLEDLRHMATVYRNRSSFFKCLAEKQKEYLEEHLDEEICTVTLVLLEEIVAPKEWEEDIRAWNQILQNNPNCKGRISFVLQNGKLEVIFKDADRTLLEPTGFLQQEFNNLCNKKAPSMSPFNDATLKVSTPHSARGSVSELFGASGSDHSLRGSLSGPSPFSSNGSDEALVPPPSPLPIVGKMLPTELRELIAQAESEARKADPLTKLGEEVKADSHRRSHSAGVHS